MWIPLHFGKHQIPRFVFPLPVGSRHVILQLLYRDIYVLYYSSVDFFIGCGAGSGLVHTCNATLKKRVRIRINHARKTVRFRFFFSVGEPQEPMITIPSLLLFEHCRKKRLHRKTPLQPLDFLTLSHKPHTGPSHRLFGFEIETRFPLCRRSPGRIPEGVQQHPCWPRPRSPSRQQHCSF